ncbi:MAG TPA: sugar nucleotide-binding protein [Kofleriaceae bacterium]|nr:sugar nucleotide-binding protein [Kofleriaceae bacterium]
MTAILFGASSMLGYSLFRARPAISAYCNAKTRRVPAGVAGAIDLDDEPAVAALFARVTPSLIVQCAGVCDVESCEQSPEFAWRVNVEAMQILLRHAPAASRIVYLSSDHVFSGDGGPYDERTPTDPLSVYGQTRVAAEQLMLARPNTLVVRSGPWIGPSASGRNGHLDWLRYRHARGLPMTVVADEARSAVWAEQAAERVWRLAASPITGVRHLATPRAIGRPELAAYLDQRFAIGARVTLQYRRDRNAPHPGRVELRTMFDDEYAATLSAVVP